MKKFLIEFQQNIEINIDNEILNYKPGDMIKVTKEEMLLWIENARKDNIKIFLFEIKPNCIQKIMPPQNTPKCTGYTDNPVLETPDDIWYLQGHCAWGIDKNNKVYWKKLLTQ